MSSTPPAPQYIAPQQQFAAPTNVLAIISLVTSLIGIGLAGIITGHIALGQIRRTGEQGHGMALAGLIVGYVTTGLAILVFVAWFLFAFVFIAFAATQAGTTGYGAGY
jgi:hypothetical protein